MSASTFDGKINAATRPSDLDVIVLIDDKIYEPTQGLNVGDMTVNIVEGAVSHSVSIIKAT